VLPAVGTRSARLRQRPSQRLRDGRTSTSPITALQESVWARKRITRPAVDVTVPEAELRLAQRAYQLAQKSRPCLPTQTPEARLERCTASTDSPAVGQRSAGDRRQNPHQALDDSCRWWTTRWRRASHVTAAARPGAAAHFERRKMQSSDWRLLTVALSFRGAVRIAVHCEQSSLALASGSQDASRLRGACLRCPRASRIRPAAQWGIRAAPGESSLRTAPSSGGQSRFHNENNIRAISMIRANCPHQMGF
jgi:hypothetical protein